jgi:hypothetical protein
MAHNSVIYFLISSCSDLLFCQPSIACGPHHNPRSTRASILELFYLFFRYSHHNIDDATELWQCSRRSILFHGPRIVEVPVVRDREVRTSLYACRWEFTLQHIDSYPICVWFFCDFCYLIVHAPSVCTSQIFRKLPPVEGATIQIQTLSP